MTREDLFQAIGMVEEERLAGTEELWNCPASSEGNISVRGRKKNTSIRKLILLAAVVAVLSTLFCVASALGLVTQITAKLRPAQNPGQDLSNAYSNSIPVENDYMVDYKGDSIEMPTMERVEPDSDQMEKILGEYAYTVEASVSIGGNTIRLQSFSISELGIGTVSYEIENPNGVPYSNAGYGAINLGGVPGQNLLEPSIYFNYDSEDLFERGMATEYNYLVQERENGNVLELVNYFGFFDREILGETVTMVFQTQEGETASIDLTPQSYAPAVTLTADNGKMLRISGQGATVERNDSGLMNVESLVLHLADGTDYAVVGEGINNVVSSLIRTNSKEQGMALAEGKSIDTIAYENVYLFNRVIDPDKVVSATVVFHWWEEKRVGGDGTQPGDYEYTRQQTTVNYTR